MKILASYAVILGLILGVFLSPAYSAEKTAQNCNGLLSAPEVKIAEVDYYVDREDRIYVFSRSGAVSLKQWIKENIPNEQIVCIVAHHWDHRTLKRHFQIFYIP